LISSAVNYGLSQKTGGPCALRQRWAKWIEHFFWGRQFLNPYAFYGLDGEATELVTLADTIRTEQA
jgi:hypothetical protein